MVPQILEEILDYMNKNTYLWYVLAVYCLCCYAYYISWYFKDSHFHYPNRIPKEDHYSHLRSKQIKSEWGYFWTLIIKLPKQYCDLWQCPVIIPKGGIFQRHVTKFFASITLRLLLFFFTKFYSAVNDCRISNKINLDKIMSNGISVRESKWNSRTTTTMTTPTISACRFCLLHVLHLKYSRVVNWITKILTFDLGCLSNNQKCKYWMFTHLALIANIYDRITGSLLFIIHTIFIGIWSIAFYLRLLAGELSLLLVPLLCNSKYSATHFFMTWNSESRMTGFFQFFAAIFNPADGLAKCHWLSFLPSQTQHPLQAKQGVLAKALHTSKKQEILDCHNFFVSFLSTSTCSSLSSWRSFGRKLKEK